MSDWINIEDGTPKHMEEVICVRDKGNGHKDIEICVFDRDMGEFIDAGGWGFSGLYWLRLPEPPK